MLIPVSLVFGLIVLPFRGIGWICRLIVGLDDELTSRTFLGMSNKERQRHIKVLESFK